jgi:predicted ArsR family transcriptional regulator
MSPSHPKKRETPAKRLAAVLAVLRERDATVSEVAKRAGLRYEQARRNITALQESGIIEFKRWGEREADRGMAAALFGWRAAP